MRGFLWTNLEREVAAEFHQEHPLTFDAAPQSTWFEDGWLFFEPEATEETRALERMTRAHRQRLGLCIRCREPRAEGSKNYCAYHVALNRPSVRKRLATGIAASQRLTPVTLPSLSSAAGECPLHHRTLRLRLESNTYRCTKKDCTYEQGVTQYTQEKLKRMEAQSDKKKKLPDDREGKRVHFKILVREEQEDRSVSIREVDGYLTMNVMPDGKSLREVFITLGKAGSSDAMYDEWAKQVSNRLQEGATVDQVFKPHVGTQFGDRGYLATPIGAVKKCTSVLDLISSIVIERFGAKEAA